MYFGPQKILLSDIGLTSISAFLCGVVGSLWILLIVFMSGNLLSLQNTSTGMSQIFPFILSLTTFFGTCMSVMLNSLFLAMIQPNLYKNTRILQIQIWFFCVMSYFLFTPLYLILGKTDSTHLLFIFLIHTLFIVFWTHIIRELLNNYKYILVSLYGSFLSIFFLGGILFFIFRNNEIGEMLLFSLTLLLPLMLLCITFFVELFQYFYSAYYQFTNLDPLGNIFVRIEKEEQEKLQEESQKNII